MVGLVIRKSARGLVSYFERDFDSPMWLDESGRRVAHPRVGQLRPGRASVEPWQELDRNAFLATVCETDAHRKDGGVLAVELGFAPPKSVSIAGLADVEVSPTLIATHQQAVDDALGFLSPLLLARAEGELIPCGVSLMEVTHPWNRVSHPQLHSHVVLLRDFSYSHALWTTPIFLLQRALREVYHFSLCSRLVQLGLGVFIDEPGSLAWELQGVPSDLVRRFSKRSRSLKEFVRESSRGFFSLGAEFRVASWVSRRQFPKTDPSVSLCDARREWRKEVLPMKLTGRTLGMEVGPVALKHVFRLSSVVTRQQFVGTHLRWWLGSPLPLNRALSQAAAILDSYVERGEILHAGQVYCWPETLDTEAAILKEITASFGAGPRLSPPRGKPLLRKSALTVLSGDNGVKIVSTDGLHSPKQEDLRTEKGFRFDGVVRTIGQWNSSEIQRDIENRGTKPLVIFVEEPFSIGDFGSVVDRVLRTGNREIIKPETPFWIGGRRTVVKHGDLERKESGAGRFAEVKRWLSSVLSIGSASETGPGVVLAPWLSADRLRGENWHRLHTLSGGEGHQIEILRPLPWERLLDQSWEGLGIFCHRTTVLPVKKTHSRELRTIRHGTLLFITGPTNNGMIPVVGRQRAKLLPVAALKALVATGEHHLLLVEKISVSLRPDVPLTCPVHFESDGQVFDPGHVLVVEKVKPSGKVHFRGGLHWPHDHLVMEPAFYVREFPLNQQKLPTILAQAEWGRNGVDQIVALPRADLTVISSKNPIELCAKLDRELGHHRTARRLTINHQVRKGELQTGLEPLFPAASIWAELRKNLVFPYPALSPVRAKRKPISPPARAGLTSPAPDPLAPPLGPEKTISSELAAPQTSAPAKMREADGGRPIPNSSKNTKKKPPARRPKEEKPPSELK